MTFLLVAAGWGVTYGQEVDFTSEVKPILDRSCAKCHGPGKAKGGYRLDYRAAALRGGDEGVAIIPGNSEDSPLIHVIEDGDMPPAGKGPPVSEGELAILRRWIDQGARWQKAPVQPRAAAEEPSGKDERDQGASPAVDPGRELKVPAEVPIEALPAPAEVPDFALSISPAVRWFSVDGNEQKFREHNWLPDGWSGGTHFTFEKWIDPETSFSAEGNVDAPETFDLTATLRRQGLGYVRGGAEKFRRYYNNVGGYYEPFAETGMPAFELGRNLHLDSGRAWVELGLRQRKLPEITLGYEFRFRDGVKPTLHWGPSVQGMAARNIYPATKEIREEVHLLRAKVKFDWSGLVVEDNFLAEFVNLETQRFEASPQSFSPSPSVFTTIDESHDSIHLSNTFSVQKQIRDWWLVSGGYYYSYVDADASLNQRTLNAAGEAVVGQHWFAQPVVLEWQTHMFNASTRVGPWKGVTISGGVQGAWEDQDAIGSATQFFGLPDPMVPIPPFFVSTVGSSKQTATATEFATLRYDRLPRTVIFAEAEFQQERTDHFESDSGLLGGFVRDTELRTRDQDYRVGVTYSPTRRVSLNTHYRYRLQEDRYDLLRDELPEGGGPNEGYSAFIEGRDLESHEFRARLNLRPQPWLRTMLTYDRRSTDYTTDTAPVGSGLPPNAPGGDLLAGQHDANVYSLNVVLTPWQKLALHGSLSYQDSRTRTASNGDPAVDDYEGDLYSLLIGGSYQLSDRTELVGSYTFSRADFAQDNSAGGLPLGIEYEMHSLQAGLGTQLRENLHAQLQYQLQNYDEPTSGGFNDYTAHGVFLNCRIDWE